jgi:hypothetical protein
MTACIKIKVIACLLIGIIIFGALAALFIEVFGTTTQLSGIQAQLTDAGGEIIANDDNVVFNEILNDQSSNITYNTVTGEFIITEPGNYYVDWWFAADGAGPAINVSFAIAVDGIPFSTASTPNVSGVIAGEALVTVTTTPAIITLINVTGEDAFVPITPVQSNIVILEVVNQ